MALRVTGMPILALSRPMVVLVDDDPAVTHAVQFSFDLEGLEVRSYRDAESLLANPALPENGCLVIDQNLPGMSGLSLLERLREDGVQLPAILITTNPRAALRDRAATAGIPIVEKPLLTDALLTTVRTLLSRSA
jgi:FixJ family two-component response regulator